MELIGILMGIVVFIVLYSSKTKTLAFIVGGVAILGFWDFNRSMSEEDVDACVCRMVVGRYQDFFGGDVQCMLTQEGDTYFDKLASMRKAKQENIRRICGSTASSVLSESEIALIKKVAHEYEIQRKTTVANRASIASMTPLERIDTMVWNAAVIFVSIICWFFYDYYRNRKSYKIVYKKIIIFFCLAAMFWASLYIGIKLTVLPYVPNKKIKEIAQKPVLLPA